MGTTKFYLLLWIAIMVMGVALLIFKITVDSEPGAIPLFLTIAGIIGYLITRFRKRA